MALKKCIETGLVGVSQMTKRKSKAKGFRRRLNLLWKEFFRDPSVWLDNRSTKIGFKSPDFKHRTTKESLWIDGFYNPSWVSEELTRRGMLSVQDNHKNEILRINNAVSKEEVDIVEQLKICGKEKDLCKGNRLHVDILNMHLHERNPYIASALITMYSRCGVLAKAQEVLDQLLARNEVTSWNSLISAYIRHGQAQQALKCCERMLCENVSINVVTIICISKACCNLCAIDKGKQIHIQIIGRSLMNKDTMLGTALVDMYSKCGALTNAQQVFDELIIRDVVSWSAMISGYARQGQGQEALNCFERMQKDGVVPNAVTFISVLKACGSINAIEKGKRIHDDILRRGLLIKDIVLGNTLVDMYAKCGFLDKAEQVMDNLPHRDVVSWSVLISGYVQQGQCHQALKCFEQMKREGISPNIVAFICALKAVGNAGAIDIGNHIHDEIISKGLCESDIVIGNALIDMYTKCGLLLKAQQVLDDLPVRDVVSWSTLISGYVQQGQANEALNCYERMQREGIVPDAVTFLSVLNACSLLGLLDEAQMHFKDMSTKYNITPTVDHYTCLVRTYGFVGQFDKALSVITKMPSSNYIPVWVALLNSCQKWGNVKLGRFVFDRAVRLDSNNAVLYTFMAAMYAAAGMQEHKKEIEAMRFKKLCIS